MAMVKLGFTAQQIINEGRVTGDTIEQIKSWTSDENLPNVTDEQVVLFLIACRNDLLATKTAIREFYAVRKSTPELFNNRNVFAESLQKQLITMKYCIFPKRTEDGCVIIYQSLQDFDYRNYFMVPAIKLLLMTMEASSYDNPPNGMIMLYDVEGVSWIHLSKLRFKLALSYCKYIQECLPLRVKCVHVINTMTTIYKLMSLFRHVLKEEAKDILHFHPSNTDLELFAKEWIPKSHLPEDLGGYLPSTNILHKQNIEKLIEMHPYFDAEETQRQNWIDSFKNA